MSVCKYFLEKHRKVVEPRVQALDLSRGDMVIYMPLEDFDREPAMTVFETTPENTKEINQVFFDKCYTMQINFLFVALPDDPLESTKIRKWIKRQCEHVLGYGSQCFKPMNHDLSGIRMRCGGRSKLLEHEVCGLNDSSGATMVLGADVTHFRDNCTPSIAAFVASIDSPGSAKYKALLSPQPAGVEIISNLYTPPSTDKEKAGGLMSEVVAAVLDRILVSYAGNVVSVAVSIMGSLVNKLEFKVLTFSGRDMLQAFQLENNGKLPDRIIFYRDGVGDWQFHELLNEEGRSIKEACASMKDGYHPKLTFVVVQKRHHTRFFSGETDSGNLQPGTVIDTVVTRDRLFDFFLCNGEVVKGNTRLQHYVVLYDENGFTADQIQKITHCLCHICCRSDTPVSLVSPAYYAHLAAARGREYLESYIGENDLERPLNVRQARKLISLRPNIAQTMFYA
ncbi:argonaute108 [Artemisia annua]|uniref:Argonaute108 n=1 Tax=Artemisia annua TaxID=35608 RepID=A0A2U1LV21_ARTAN|nr:argonaute108 [Artemisia annua]